MPKTIEKESWVKHFRRQIKLTCSDSWYVTNNRGRIRLKVEGVGSVALPYDWTEKGAAQAIQKRLRFSNYQMHNLSWFFGFGVGVIATLILHWIFSPH